MQTSNFAGRQWDYSMADFYIQRWNERKIPSLFSGASVECRKSSCFVVFGLAAAERENRQIVVKNGSCVVIYSRNLLKMAHAKNDEDLPNVPRLIREYHKKPSDHQVNPNIF